MAQKRDVTINQLVSELQELNPNADIRIGSPMGNQQYGERIFSSVLLGKLKIPNDFWYIGENTITNKYRSASSIANGSYMSVQVTPLKGNEHITVETKKQASNHLQGLQKQHQQGEKEI